MEVPLVRSSAGGSGTFLAELSDTQRWWVKPPNNPQGPRIVLTEYLVGCLGALIGAPTCDVAIVAIPSEIAGWEYRPGSFLEVGLAHGSRAVDDAQEEYVLDHRDRDDNRRRHAGIFALYDWCWGADDQWLYCETDDRKLYSHDHGWYFPGTGGTWTEATLLARVDEPHPPPYPASGLDVDELRRLAKLLQEPLRDELCLLLQSVPKQWHVVDAELEALGYFLERRAAAVADRLLGLIGGTT